MGQRSPSNNSFKDSFTAEGVNSAPISDAPPPDMHCPEIPGSPDRINFWSSSCRIKQQMPIHEATCFPVCVHKRRTAPKKVKGRSLADTLMFAEMILRMKDKNVDFRRIGTLLHISHTEVLRVLRNRKFYEYFITGTEAEKQRKLQEGLDKNMITENGSLLYREDHQAVVKLYKEGLKQREICEKLGVSLEVVKKVLKKTELN